MSNLYDVVKDVINAPNMEEANDRLYGVNGISINSDEYFNNIVSNFIKKKEYIIQKRDNSLVFDLDLVFNINNSNDIWLCIFISEYIREEINKTEVDIKSKIDTIQKEINEIKEKCNNHGMTNDEAQPLLAPLYKQKKYYNNLLDRLGECRKGFFNLTDKINVEFNKEVNINEIDLKTIKEDIKAFHILRNCVDHGHADIDKELKIKNYDIEISIPIEYLDGFNKGRIIANEEDMVIFERTNTIASPLLESLGYDVKKVESFFYNVDPELLYLLLEKLDFQYDELYKIPDYMFSYKESVFYYLEKEKMHINFVKTLPYGAFRYLDSALKLMDKGVVLSLLPLSAFEKVDNAMYLLKNGIELERLPKTAFYYPDAIIKLNKKHVDIRKISDEAILDIDTSLDLLKRGINIEEISPVVFIDLRASYKYPEYSEKISILLNNGIKEDVITHDVLMGDPFDVIELKNNGIDITKIPEEAILEPHITLDLKQRGIDVEKLPKDAFYNIDNTYFLLQKGINIENLPNGAFLNPKMVLIFIENGIDLSHLSSSAYDCTENGLLVLRNMGLFNDDVDPEVINFYLSFAGECSELELKDFEKYTPYSSGLDEYTIGFLKYLIREDKTILNLVVINRLNKLRKNNINIFKLPSLVLSKILISSLNYSVELSENLYNPNFECEINDLENIEYLLEKVDYDYERLNEFPLELFDCDMSIMDEMLKTYNSNVAKSIFGINNPKLIATLVYCDSVFRNYQKEYCNDVNIEPLSFISNNVDNTYKYRNNYIINTPLNNRNDLDDTDIFISDYYSQFTIDYDGNIRRSLDNIKKNILDKLRNSSCHFRFKPVKDNDGNIVEDKIYLYDKFDDGTINFNLIIDLKELVDIAHEVEIVINNKTMEEVSTHTR